MTPARRATIEADLRSILRATGDDRIRRDLFLGYVSGLKVQKELGPVAGLVAEILKDKGWAYEEVLPELHGQPAVDPVQPATDLITEDAA